MGNFNFSFLLQFLLLSLWKSGCRGADLKLNDVSGSLNLADVDGYVAAVADVTNDRFVDLLVVKDDACTIWVWNDGRFTKGAQLNSNNSIHSVLPADFDGDGFVDILLVSELESSNSSQRKMHSLLVYWGGSLPGTPTTVSSSFAGLPSLVDANLDLFADIMGQDSSGKVVLLCSSSNSLALRTFTDCSDLFTGSSQQPLGSNPAFFLAGSTPTPVISGVSRNSSGDVQLNRWTTGEDAHWVAGSPGSVLAGAAVLGTATWQDMDLDGILDVLVPACWDADCNSTSIVILFMQTDLKPAVKGMSNVSLPVRFNTDLTVPFTATPLQPTVQCGDMDLDGYVDAVVVGLDEKGLRRLVFLSNTPCSSCGDGAKRTLGPKVLDIGGVDVLSASVFDLEGDGTPDILLSTTNSSLYSVRALQQKNNNPNAFAKVIVASCPSAVCRSKPGTTPLGTVVAYENVLQSAAVVSSSVPVLAQVGTMSLQYPMAVIGLRRPISYVRSMEVVLAAPPQKKLTRRWPAIIPNSKVLIVANPFDQPSQWEARLLLNAGQAVWQTALIFSAICGILVLVLIFLHRREKNEDELAKREQSHQFHFDAL